MHGGTPQSPPSGNCAPLYLLRNVTPKLRLLDMEKGKRKAEKEIVVCRKKQKREESGEDVEKKEEIEEADGSSLSSFDDDDDHVLKFPLLVPSIGKAQKVRAMTSALDCVCW